MSTLAEEAERYFNSLTKEQKKEIKQMICTFGPMPKLCKEPEEEKKDGVAIAR